MMDTLITTELKTSDTYEASFYLMYGANIESIRQRPVSKNRARKRGYLIEYVVHLNDVPQWAINMWRTGQCYVNLQEFVITRKRLKRAMKRS